MARNSANTEQITPPRSICTLETVESNTHENISLCDFIGVKRPKQNRQNKKKNASSLRICKTIAKRVAQSVTKLSFLPRPQYRIKTDLVQNGRRRGRSRSRSRAQQTTSLADRLGVRGQRPPPQLLRSRSRSRQRLNSIGNQNKGNNNLLRRRTNSTANLQQRQQRPRMRANSQIRQRARANSQPRIVGVRRRGGGAGANNNTRRIARRKPAQGAGAGARKQLNGNRNGIQNGRVIKRRQIGGGPRNGGQKVSQQPRGRSRSR